MSRSFNGPHIVPGYLAQTSSLCATSWGAHRWDAFGTDASGGLWHWWLDTTQNPSAMPVLDPQMQGQLVPAGGLSAVSLGTDQMDIYGVSTKGTLLHWSYNQGGGNFYGQPDDLSGPLATNGLTSPGHFDNFALALGGPSAIIVDENIHVFAAAINGTLLHWVNNSTTPQEIGARETMASLGGVSAVSWGTGRIDVFSVGVNGSVWHIWSEGSGPYIPWQSETLAGQVYADPATGYASPLSAVSWGPGRLDLFGIGNQDTLLHWYYDRDNGITNFPTGPQALQGKPAGSLTAHARNTGNLLNIFAGTFDAGGNPELLHWWYSPLDTNFDSPPEKFTTYSYNGPIGLPVTTISRLQGLVEVFSCAANGSLAWWWGE